MGITNQTREITHDTSTTTTILACSKPPVHVIGLVGCFANHGDNSVVKGGDNTNSNAPGAKSAVLHVMYLGKEYGQMINQNQP
jgi:hypothetical protein